MFALLCLIEFFSSTPTDWLRRTSPIWHILCLVGLKTFTQSINRSYVAVRRYRHSAVLEDDSPQICLQISLPHVLWLPCSFGALAKLSSLFSPSMSKPVRFFYSDPFLRERQYYIKQAYLATYVSKNKIRTLRCWSYDYSNNILIKNNPRSLCKNVHQTHLFIDQLGLIETDLYSAIGLSAPWKLKRIPPR